MNSALEWFIAGLVFVIFGCIILGLDVSTVLGSAIIFIALFAVVADWLEW